MIGNVYQNVTASIFKHCFMYSPFFLVYNVWQVWEIVYAKDGSAKEVLNVMQLKGHKVSIIIWGDLEFNLTSHLYIYRLLSQKIQR